MGSQAAGAKTIDQGAQGVLVKLIIFSLSLGILPIGSYFISNKYIWKGNSTYSAITAIVAANIVLVAYIVTSVVEDQQEQGEKTGKVPTKAVESRKER
ncbi:hypothetical protein EW146_g2961 [Bondarzewia mesenterica]|uniref:Vacuolar ATPase assembly integral membrane protein VMA21 n=1 Tax=Bondarzewia mesenterica TaxID=1095465 RepID=A0A4S4LZK5_9AGAM|nr:hypothetical protein EW146_g2961 [Bondarzewia mesenterica]